MCIISTHTGENLMDVHELRDKAKREEIDYLFLINELAGYRSPRNKIQALLRSKELIRVKKGLYIFGEKIRREVYSKEVLANLIYGPSAISLEYALSYYGFIPERVEVITSITNNRNKRFYTPVGDFEYHYISPKKYSIGITQIELTSTKKFLIAVKEKALADVLMLRTEMLTTVTELHEHLIENLRIEGSSLKSLDYKIVSTIANVYRNKNVFLLQRMLEIIYA